MGNSTIESYNNNKDVTWVIMLPHSEADLYTHLL